MQGSIASAAKWLGGSLVIASIILAIAIQWAAWKQQQNPRGLLQPETPAVAAKDAPPVRAAVEPPSPEWTDLPQPGKLVVAWNNKAKRVPDPVNGGDGVTLLARIYPGPDGTGKPENADGKLTIDLYGQRQRDVKGDPSLLEKWVINPETLKELGKKDQHGFGYTVVLPWGTYRRDIQEVCLIVRYQPEQGLPQTNRSVVTIDHSEAQPWKPEGNE